MILYYEYGARELVATNPQQQQIWLSIDTKNI